MIEEIVISKAAYNKLWDNRLNVLNGTTYLVMNSGMVLIDANRRMYVQSGDRGDSIPYQLAVSSTMLPVE